jgi:hypothetical protein
MTENEKKTIVEFIDETFFYNLLQDMAVSKLILDMRDKDSFLNSHAKSAINLIGIENYDNNKTIDENFNNKYIKNRGLLYKKCIIYHDEEKYLKKFISLFENDCKFEYIFALKSYKTFEKKYPFMCTTPNYETQPKPFPTEVFLN